MNSVKETKYYYVMTTQDGEKFRKYFDTKVEMFNELITFYAKYDPFLGEWDSDVINFISEKAPGSYPQIDIYFYEETDNISNGDNWTGKGEDGTSWYKVTYDGYLDGSGKRLTSTNMTKIKINEKDYYIWPIERKFRFTLISSGYNYVIYEATFPDWPVCIGIKKPPVLSESESESESNN